VPSANLHACSSPQFLEFEVKILHRACDQLHRGRGVEHLNNISDIRIPDKMTAKPLTYQDLGFRLVAQQQAEEEC
jgi:hypothetical protein